MEERNAKLANVLIGIFFIILAGTLIVDLITFWPILEARPQSLQHAVSDAQSDS